MPDTQASAADPRVNEIEANANKLAAELYAVIQAGGPPTSDTIGATLAALAHVTALVLDTVPQSTGASLAMFLSILGQELLQAQALSAMSADTEAKDNELAWSGFRITGDQKSIDEVRRLANLEVRLKWFEEHHRDCPQPNPAYYGRSPNTLNSA